MVLVRATDAGAEISSPKQLVNTARQSVVPAAWWWAFTSATWRQECSAIARRRR